MNGRITNGRPTVRDNRFPWFMQRWVTMIPLLGKCVTVLPVQLIPLGLTKIPVIVMVKFLITIRKPRLARTRPGQILMFMTLRVINRRQVTRVRTNLLGQRTRRLIPRMTRRRRRRIIMRRNIRWGRLKVFQGSVTRRIIARCRRAGRKLFRRCRRPLGTLTRKIPFVRAFHVKRRLGSRRVIFTFIVPRKQNGVGTVGPRRLRSFIDQRLPFSGMTRKLRFISGRVTVLRGPRLSPRRGCFRIPFLLKLR